MHEGVTEYVGRLGEMGYPYEFAFLTATNPPLYDKGGFAPANWYIISNHV